MTNRTKLWIAEAMKRLMNKKSIEKIRVTEICNEAQIGRPVFYYHFKDKYDLVAWIFYDSAIDTNIISSESAAHHMNKMRNDFLFYKRAFEDSSQNALWKYIVEYYTNRYTQEAKRILNTNTLDPQIQFSIKLYCYGCVGMTKEWLLHDNITPAKTIVEMMFTSMPQVLRDIYFK
ncbi:TetR/AcrR family transcriptional regulator C-terminal domain-containing protein [Kandleria sp.]|uniref:TetR/AcrR family transcriptional regulator C-terminal domain-containing protein n=1 Tax=Kandleria sp. TaxID=2774291 RepID=UPI001B78439B|nr:TetR/AcrR family transcriptional regulator C-terminal domain-containing protein [Kandleria sp.]MBP3275209.1 TetR/AcrR family transcriptional regulator C-terminal domain-containing protein [Kandleria sp.]